MVRVSRLSVTPLKGSALLDVEEVRLEHGGVADNRRFYLVDELERLIGASRETSLVRVRASYQPDRRWLSLAFPDGSLAEGEVKLAAPITTDFWGRPVAAHLVEGPWSEAVSRWSGRELRLARCDEPGAGVDSHPVSVMSTASLRELATQAGAESVDGRRFRMLVEVDGCAAHEEDTWAGRSLSLGEAVVRVEVPDPRCVATTINPDSGLADLQTLHAIKAYRGLREQRYLDFGMYAAVESPGRIRVGDEVKPL